MGLERIAILQIGQTEIDGLRVAFRVRRNGSGLDSAEITAWGLEPQSYDQIGRPDTITRLIAGDENRTGLLLSGTTVPNSLRRTYETDGSIVTRWQVQESGAQVAATRLSASWGGSVKASTLLSYVAAQIGLNRAAQELPRDPEYARGYVLTGAPRAALDSLAADCGCKWAIRDGRLLLLPLSGAASSRQIELAPDSGLIGYPERSDRGRVVAPAVLEPGLMVGDPVRIGGDFLAGDYVIEEVEHNGDSEGGAWDTTVVGRPRG